MVFSELNSALSLFARLWRLLAKRKTGDGRPDTIASRFVLLFESHGVHRNQIPRFLGQGLTLADVSDDNALMGVLTDEMLDTVADRFAVRREWIDGASDQIYPLHDFYKKADEFPEFLEGLVRSESSRATGVVLVGESKDHETDTLLILEELFASIGDKPIYRYHICGNWIFDYWKSRAYLAACVAGAWKKGIYVNGRKVDIAVVRRYREGTLFLEQRDDGALPRRGKLWHPEDMALRPSAFLEGLDEGSFGREMGLRLWLDLDADGLMGTGLPPINVRQEFEKALSGVIEKA